MISPLGEPCLVVLTDKYERREKDRFQRHYQRQKRKWERIKVLKGQDGVEQDPAAKPCHVNVNEGHAAAKESDGFGKLFAKCAILLLRFFDLDNLEDITLGFLFDRPRIVCSRRFFSFFSLCGHKILDAKGIRVINVWFIVTGVCPLQYKRRRSGFGQMYAIC